MRFQADFGSLEGVGRRHRFLGPVEAAQNEFAEEAEADFACGWDVLFTIRSGGTRARGGGGVADPPALIVVRSDIRIELDPSRLE